MIRYARRTALGARAWRLHRLFDRRDARRLRASRWSWRLSAEPRAEGQSAQIAIGGSTAVARRAGIDHAQLTL